MTETRRRGRSGPLFDSEGAAGVHLNDLDPVNAGRMAAALGVYVRGNRADEPNPPVTVLASDGRPLVAEILAAVGEGLRWAGCHVTEIGPATAPCVAFAILHLQCDGGILVGNPLGQVHTLGLKLWSRAGRPLSEPGDLETVRRLFESGVTRPTRRSGSLHRFQAEASYLDRFAEYYHALRPLRLLLQTGCPPLFGYLNRLTRTVACQVVPCHCRPGQVPEQVRAERAHLAVRIDDDGERCRLLDERGREVPGEQLLLLVARHLLAERRRQAVVFEEGTSGETISAVRRLGGRVIAGGSRRAEMDCAMRENGALLGGGPSGRFWHRFDDGHCLPDALMTLTLLLKILSRSDRPLSAVLDAEAPVG